MPYRSRRGGLGRLVIPIAAFAVLAIVLGTYLTFGRQWFEAPAAAVRAVDTVAPASQPTLISAGAPTAMAAMVQGTVLDGITNQPLAGVKVVAGDQSAVTDEVGQFTLTGVTADAELELQREGYRSTTLTVPADGPIEAQLQPFVLEGAVVDSATGAPLAGAKVKAGDRTVTTGADGKYSLAAVAPGTSVSVEAPGHAPSQFAFDPEVKGVKLQAQALRIQVLSAWSGQPVKGAKVQSGTESLTVDDKGVAALKSLGSGAKVSVSATGFATASVTYTGQSEARVELQPEAVTGTVKGKDGKPVVSASVADGKTAVRTDSSGRFSLKGAAPDAVLTVRRAEYAPLRVDVKKQSQLEITLEPRPVKALYLTYYGVGSDELLSGALDTISKTEANALVIDIKGDRGWLAYQSKVPMVAEIGAQQEIMIPDVQKFVKEMHDRDIYLIARIVTFKDNPLATAHPEWAVQDTQTGQPWVDLEGLLWIDAFHEAAWDYNIAIAREAAEYGFDEVQFDYVRFPTDAGAGTSVDRIGLSQENVMKNRVAAIGGFLKKASDELAPLGALVGADVFGYVCFREDDMGIGQHLETLGQSADVISPMVYPTLFWDGLPLESGIVYAGDAASHPYEVIDESMKIAQKRLKASQAHAVLRPWLQYYNDYIKEIHYGDAEIKAQVKATYDNDIPGWMFWDPSNEYAKGGLEPRQ